MRKLFFIGVMLIATLTKAQTREIAFKSHSGHAGHFKTAMEHALFGSEDIGFGLPSHIISTVLDSVIYVSANKVVLVQSEYKRDFNEARDAARLVERRRIILREHPYFFKQHALDSIRILMKADYKYASQPEPVVFINYDNSPAKPGKKAKAQKKIVESAGKEENKVPVSFIPAMSDNDTAAPFPMLWVVTGIILVAAAGGWLSWKLYQPATVATI